MSGDIAGISGVATLGEIADRPELVMGLPRPALQALMFQALKVQEACFMALVSPEVPAPAPTPEDRLLSATEAAALIGISPLTLLRQRQRAPYRDFVVPTGTRRPGFSLRRIQDYIALHAGATSTARRPVLTGR